MAQISGCRRYSMNVGQTVVLFNNTELHHWPRTNKFTLLERPSKQIHHHSLFHHQKLRNISKEADSVKICNARQRIKSRTGRSDKFKLVEEGEESIQASCLPRQFFQGTYLLQQEVLSTHSSRSNSPTAEASCFGTMRGRYFAFHSGRQNCENLPLKPFQCSLCL